MPKKAAKADATAEKTGSGGRVPLRIRHAIGGRGARVSSSPGGRRGGGALTSAFTGMGVEQSAWIGIVGIEVIVEPKGQLVEIFPNAEHRAVGKRQALRAEIQIVVFELGRPGGAERKLETGAGEKAEARIANIERLHVADRIVGREAAALEEQSSCHYRIRRVHYRSRRRRAC